MVLEADSLISVDAHNGLDLG
ncbi:MAG: hypothetical protein JWQ22_1055, partial [Devosia sp.]|nr:hypothetical protein [Devosia sp.]